MTINEVHERFITLKRQGQGAYHSREEIDRFLNDASTDKYNEEKRLFEVNGYISDNLRNCKAEPATITLTSGFGDLPPDYDFRTNASTLSNKKIEIVPEGEWIERINDPIAVPTSTEPICAIREQIEVVPAQIAAMKLFYLKKPDVMVFGYTEDGDGNTIYDSGTSTDPNWPDSAMPDVLKRALAYAGVSLPDQVMMQAKSIIKTTEGV